MAIKWYSASPKAWRSLIPLQRCSRWIIQPQPQPTGPKSFSVTYLKWPYCSTVVTKMVGWVFKNIHTKSTQIFLVEKYVMKTLKSFKSIYLSPSAFRNYHDKKIRHTPTHGILNSCFDLFRSHQQCTPWSPPLEPTTTVCRSRNSTTEPLVHATYKRFRINNSW